jgi:hypothetical protein
VERHRRAILVEEEEVEGEAHAEGMDAGAAGNQEAGPDFAAIEEGESEQAGAQAPGNSYFLAENRGHRQATKPWGKRLPLHAELRDSTLLLSPLPILHFV